MTPGARPRGPHCLRVAALVAIVAGPFGGAPGGAAPTDPAAPRLRVPRPTVDLGVVYVGDLPEARYAVRNEGDGVLRIHSAEVGCRCTVASFDEEIAPGEVGAVRVVLDTAELLGPVTKGVILHTNDPERRKLALTLKAQVVGSVALLPQPHMFMRERPGGWVGRVLIRKEPGQAGTLRISDVRTSDPLFRASVERLDEPRPRGGGLPEGRPGDWMLEVRFADDRPRFGRHDAVVRFRTGLERQGEVTVRVESDVEAPVHLSTSRLDLVAAEGGPRGTLFASVRSGLDPDDLRVEATTDGVEVDVQPATGRIVKVDVRWTGEAALEGELEFRIGREVVRLPVVWDGS